MTNQPGTIDITQVKNLDVTANPAALGLTALGVITVLFSLSNAGLFVLAILSSRLDSRARFKKETMGSRRFERLTFACKGGGFRT
jgi:predicted Co/Zn/Cd cation transporter (cation efflux family)